MVGGLIQGVAVADGARFNGSVFDIFRLFAVFTALAVLSGGWLHLGGDPRIAYVFRMDTATFDLLVRGARRGLCCRCHRSARKVRAAWTAHQAPLIVIAALFLVISVVLIPVIGGRADGRPFFLGLALFGFGVLSRACWFVALYLASIAALAASVFTVKSVLWLAK